IDQATVGVIPLAKAPHRPCEGSIGSHLRIRVLVVTNLFPSRTRPAFGGFVAHQVRSLEQAGVMVHVACTRAASGKPTYFRSRHQVTDLIREFQPNLVHVHFGYTALAVLPCPLPKVLTLCGDDISGTADGVGHITLKSRLGATVTRRVARSFDAVVVMNPAMRAKLAPETVDRTVVLPYGIDTTRFMPGSRSEAREKLGLTPDGLVVTFVNSGRQRTKRLDLARAAVDRLKADGHS